MGKGAQDTLGYPRRALRCLTPSGGGRIPWNQWQPSHGMGGSFAVESVAGFVWNTHADDILDDKKNRARVHKNDQRLSSLDQLSELGIEPYGAEKDQ